MKTCTKCKEAKPLVDFHCDRAKHDGRATRCKKCCLSAKRAAYAADPEKFAERGRNYREPIKKKRAEKSREYYWKNVEKCKQANRKRYSEATEEQKEYRAKKKQEWLENNPGYTTRYNQRYWENNKEVLSKNNKEWYSENKPKVRANSARWRKANPEKFAASIRRWVAANPEKAAEVSLRYKLRKINAIPDDYDVHAVNLKYKWCALLNKFTDTVWHVDHTVPLSVGGKHHHLNLQVVPQKWNNQKINKHTRRWKGVYPTLPAEAWPTP